MSEYTSRELYADEVMTEAMAIAEAELIHAPSDRPDGGGIRRALPYVAVSAGAAIGANLRYLIGLWIAARWLGPLPLGTLLINLTGSFLIGVVLAVLVAHAPDSSFVRLFFATGLLGAYTTFSSFSVETVALLEGGQFAVAALYIGLSVTGGYGAAWGGAWLVRRVLEPAR